MTEYREMLVIDEGEGDEFQAYFEVLDVIRHPSTKKIVVGKRLLERNILGPTTEDVDLSIAIYLFGPDQGNLNSKTLIQEEDALLAFNDLATHTLNVGKYSGTYYLAPESITENTEFNRQSPYTKRYEILFLQKNI